MKIAILTKKLGYTGIDKNLCSIANMLSCNHEVELIQVYRESNTHNLNKLKANIPIDFFSDFIDEFANNRLKNDTVYLIDDLYGFNFQIEISSKKPIKNKEFKLPSFAASAL